MPSYTLNFNTKRDREKLWNHLKNLKGIIQVTTKKVRSYNGRYKYYWAYVLPKIEEANIFVNDDQEPLNKGEIHEVMKIRYNPKIVHSVKNKIIIQGGSTTKLSDDEFIGQFENIIIADFRNPPYNVEIELSRYEWTQQLMDKHERMKQEDFLKEMPRQKNGIYKY